MCQYRNVQLVPANAFGSMVHCLAVVGSDLWCCTGGGTIAIFDLVSLVIKNKVCADRTAQMPGSLLAMCNSHRLFDCPSSHANRTRIAALLCMQSLICHKQASAFYVLVFVVFIADDLVHFDSWA